jgi:CheY-like chemotaxis protein
MTHPAHTVLVVEDEEDVRTAFTAYLQGAGYTVVEAVDGREALRLLRASPETFCLVLLDLFMPGMNGWQFRAEQLREPTLAAIPLVVISAAARTDLKAAELGAVAHLQKPVDMNGLVSVVATYC